jgi:hypothetical protein
LRKTLLESLSKRAGLTFLSDLHYKPYWPDIYDTLKEMEAEDYTLEEWEEAAEYILGKGVGPFDSAESVYRCILQCLKLY